MGKYIVLDCKKCSHYTGCKIPCIYVDTLANGNDRQRERQIPDNIRDSTLQQDYNSALYEMITDREARDTERLELIRQIPDLRARMIAACILAGIPQAKLAPLTHSSQGTISKIYRGVKW